MADLNIAGMIREARKRPAILAGGLAGVGVLAVMAVTRGGGSAPLAPADSSSSDTGTSSGSDALGIGSAPGGSSAFDPGGSPYGAPPLFDPFSSTDPYGGNPTTPGTTADGCSWPPPAIPAGYEGRGSWSCEQGQWTWNWIDSPPPAPGSPPGTSPHGCPLPKPTLSPALIGRYHFVCKHGKWQLEALKGAPPPPNPKPGPKPKPKPIVNVAAGTHTTYAGHRNAHGVLILERAERVHVAQPSHWNLDPATNGDTTPGKRGGMVKVRHIKGAPNHSGQVGRWLRVG